MPWHVTYLGCGFRRSLFLVAPNGSRQPWWRLPVNRRRQLGWMRPCPAHCLVLVPKGDACNTAAQVSRSISGSFGLDCAAVMGICLHGLNAGQRKWITGGPAGCRWMRNGLLCERYMYMAGQTMGVAVWVNVFVMVRLGRGHCARDKTTMRRQDSAVRWTRICAPHDCNISCFGPATLDLHRQQRPRSFFSLTFQRTHFGLD